MVCGSYWFNSQEKVCFQLILYLELPLVQTSESFHETVC